MSADILRQAAALMRERAEAATPGPWEAAGRAVEQTAGDYAEVLGMDVDCMSYCYGGTPTTPSHADAAHIASWHPAVALAVADWLDATARELNSLGDPDLSGHPQDGRRTTALAVAAAYLGGGR